MDSTGAASVREVLRRLGAEGSMLGGIWTTSGHARHGMRFASWSALCDASHCVVVKDGRVRGSESLALQGVESQRGADAKQLIVYLRCPGLQGWVRPVSCATVRSFLLASTATCSHVPTRPVLRAQDLAGHIRVSITSRRL